MNYIGKWIRLISLSGILILFCSQGFGQVNASLPDEGVYVDEKGVLRWRANEEEIKAFGVNYTVPFAHAYRSAKKLGVDPLQAIDQDVYHFARLGFDLYRVHVWDTEISDTMGNLLFNEHLNAFDYLLKKLGERNINYVLTPIAFWGNGWPEPDEPTPGFSAKYGKAACLTHPAAIKAQENYLFQFLNHVNPYTGIALKDDPRVIAVEISNEPHHREAPEAVTAFIQRMVDSVRKTGYKKPVFYNVSHSVHLMKDYFKADIQGGTFQWYPTGLGYQRELPVNVLPNVDKYPIPFDEEIAKNQGAKMVYEFDAADVGKSYAYPAMARAFREAGIQMATHFSYDPMFLAYANTEYNTHYMNLAYTPQKALSLMISSEVFHQIPMDKDFGDYPDNLVFDGFSVSYEQNLALFNSENKFYYTNHTLKIPVKESALEHIAGYGTSPLVEYKGTGAYFLDKLENGIWRLEVMPDALIVDNPYGRNSLQKEVALVQWNERYMKIKLKELGERFNIIPLDKGNNYLPEVSYGAFKIMPGAYLIKNTGMESNGHLRDGIGNIQLNEFHAPEHTVRKTYVIHEKIETAWTGEPLKIVAQVAAPDPDLKVQVFVDGFGGGMIDMEHKSGFTYEAEIPQNRMVHGFFKYYIIVSNNGKTETFPAAKMGYPYNWDFYNRNPYTVRVIDKSQPVYLFHAQEDQHELSYTRWLNTLKLVPSDHINEAEYQVNVEKLFRPDPENLHGLMIHDYTVKCYLDKKLKHLREALPNKKKLVFKARSLNDKPVKVQIALVMYDGAAFGKVIEIDQELRHHEILLSELKQVDAVIMPRPYPTFLPYFFPGKKAGAFDIKQIESLQLSIGPGIPPKELKEKHGLAMVSLVLE